MSKPISPPCLLPFNRPALVRALGAFGLYTKKGLSQYFLCGQGVNHKIAKACNLSEDCAVIEIGPGAGHITATLSPLVHSVYAIEKDEALRPWHEHFFDHVANVKFHYGDFLDTDIQHLVSSRFPLPVVIVGNIPYQITSKIIFRVLDSEALVLRLVLIMQKEVADRIISPPGKKNYSFLSVKCQFYTTPRIAFSIAPGEFLPPPNVTSAAVVFEPRPSLPLADPAARARFFRFVDASFRQRRKKASNSIAACWDGSPPRAEIEAALEGIGLNPASRAEQLSVQDFLRLFERLGG